MQLKVNYKRKKGATTIAGSAASGKTVMGIIENTEYKNTACLMDNDGVFWSAKNGYIKRIDPALCIALEMDRIQEETNFIASWP